MDHDTLEDLDVVIAVGYAWGQTSGPWGVYVLENQGAFQFQVTGFYAAPLPLRGLIVEDLNNDGFKDVAAAVDGLWPPDYNPPPPALDKVFVWYNDGNGNLGDMYVISLGLDGAAPNDLVVGHFDKLGSAGKDLVTANIHDSYSLLTNYGFQNFVVSTTERDPGTCYLDGSPGFWAFSSITAARFGPGLHQDFACAEDDYVFVDVFRGNSLGSFTYDCDDGTDRYGFSGGSSPTPYISQDIDNGQLNGGVRRDLAWTRGGPNEVTFLLGKGDGTFQFQNTDERYSPDVGGTSPVQVEVVDLNQDGFGDIVTTNHHSDNISVLINKMITWSP